MLKDGKDCFYIVDDLRIVDGVLSFHIESTFYEFEFSIIALSGFGDYMMVDCERLRPIHTAN